MRKSLTAQYSCAEGKTLNSFAYGADDDDAGSDAGSDAGAGCDVGSSGADDHTGAAFDSWLDHNHSNIAVVEHDTHPATAKDAPVHL